MSKNKICYSSNNEEFNYSEIEDVIDEVFDDPEIKIGDTRIIYSGEAVIHDAGFYMRNDITDSLSEVAYEHCGEYASDWLYSVEKEMNAELISELRKTINKWADKHKLQPSFVSVKNSKEIKVRLLDMDGGYEIVEEPQ